MHSGVDKWMVFGQDAAGQAIDTLNLTIDKVNISVPQLKKDIMYTGVASAPILATADDKFTITAGTTNGAVSAIAAGTYSTTLTAKTGYQFKYLNDEGKEVVAPSYTFSWTIHKQDSEYAQIVSLKQQVDTLNEKLERAEKDAETAIAAKDETIGSQAAKLAKKTTFTVKKIKVNGKTVKVKAVATAKNGKVTVTSIKVVK